MFNVIIYYQVGIPLLINLYVSVIEEAGTSNMQSSTNSGDPDMTKT